MNSYSWTQSFKAVYDKALAQYGRGNRNAGTYFDVAELEYLESIGCKAIEVYDLVEDCPDIDWETALLITSVRRAFHQADATVYETISADRFPAKSDEIDGIPWLPRLILKSRAKLRGQLPKELMYCCGGDRGFFKKYDIHPADFLRLAWQAGDDDGRLVDFVKGRG